MSIGADQHPNVRAGAARQRHRVVAPSSTETILPPAQRFATTTICLVSQCIVSVCPQQMAHVILAVRVEPGGHEDHFGGEGIDGRDPPCQHRVAQRIAS